MNEQVVDAPIVIQLDDTSGFDTKDMHERLLDRDRLTALDTVHKHFYDRCLQPQADNVVLSIAAQKFSLLMT